VLAVFSGLLSVEALAAEVVIVNFVYVIFMVSHGIGYSASALTGFFLGQGKIDKAKRYSRLSICFNIFITNIIIIFLVLYRHAVSDLYTSDPVTVSIVDDVLNIICLFVFFDTIHSVQAGIIRGLGLQVFSSLCTLICYYVIGLPLALWLAFN